MVTKSINPGSPLALFIFGHTKNVQNPILESLSHAEILHFFKGEKGGGVNDNCAFQYIFILF